MRVKTPALGAIPGATKIELRAEISSVLVAEMSSQIDFDSVEPHPRNALVGTVPQQLSPLDFVSIRQLDSARGRR